MEHARIVNDGNFIRIISKKRPGAEIIIAKSEKVIILNEELNSITFEELKEIYNIITEMEEK